VSGLWRKRLGFSIAFLVGTLLAVWGWTAELKNSGTLQEALTIVGHSLQIIAVFGYMLTPDEVVGEIEENEVEEFVEI
jgi:hypothetical protein